jgi:hypothetical protein
VAKRLTRANASLLRLATTSTTSIHLTLDLCVGADVLESSSVAVVAVDTGQLVSLNGSDTLNVNVTLALGRALIDVSVEGLL